jgi:hypothetical protein
MQNRLFLLVIQTSDIVAHAAKLKNLFAFSGVVWEWAGNLFCRFFVDKMLRALEMLKELTALDTEAKFN